MPSLDFDLTNLYSSVLAVGLQQICHISKVVSTTSIHGWTSIISPIKTNIIPWRSNHEHSIFRSKTKTIIKTYRIVQKKRFLSASRKLKYDGIKSCYIGLRGPQQRLNERDQFSDCFVNYFFQSIMLYNT